MTSVNLYSGMRVIYVDEIFLQDLYQNKEIPLWSAEDPFSQNEYLVLKSVTNESGSALGRVKGNKVILLKDSGKTCSIRAKNKEQVFALDALLDDTIEIVALTGKAGTGKSLLALSAAVQKIDERKYNKLIFSRPTSQVGHRDFGILPGAMEEKFYPYLQSVMCNLDFILGEQKGNLETLIDQYNAQFIPIQLMRGASFANAYIIVDEVQVCDMHEILTIGTRVGPGSKIVLLGDLEQRDERIAKEKTGLFKFVNSEFSKESEFVATLELLKSERSRVCELFSKVFEKE